MDAARKIATYADLANIPEHHIGQIIAGELHVQPRPNLAHSTVSSVLGSDLGGPYDRGRGGPGGWWIRYEPELHLREDILVPDLAGWKKSKLPAFPKGPFIEVAPNWICEILSPSTAGWDRIRKMPVYLREGVEHVWLIDPEQKTLEVFRAEPDGWKLVAAHGEDAVVRVEPFEAIELELRALWPE